MKGPIDIQRLCIKAQLFNKVGQPIDEHRKIISKLNETRNKRLQSIQKQMIENDIDQSVSENSIYIEGHSLVKSIKKGHSKVTINKADEAGPVGGSKNKDVGDIDKMLFDKKFKSYLNHKEEFEMKARRRREAIREKMRKRKQGQADVDDYFDQGQILSNTGSDYQYKNADDMQAAYDTLATGKRRKKGVKLFFGEQFEFAFRFEEYHALLKIMEDPGKALISKDLLVSYLFDQPMVMMLYSINPYILGDQISDFETMITSMLSFEQFSAFLLIDREPTYFAYTKQNLEEARKIGRGLKCAPIVGKWIDETGIYQEFMDIFDSVDMFGNGTVQAAILVKKLLLHAEKTRIMDLQVIDIVNINKLIPVNRLLYELEHQLSQEHRMWTKQQFKNYLEHYYRLPTPDKDKLITKLIMAGKFDTSYIYIVSQEVLDFLRNIFEQMEKFAEFFVKKQKFINKVTKHQKYPRLKEFFVRSEANRYIVKETVEQVLVRLYSEADSYIDIEEVLDFFTNRGRPRVIEYKVYLANLQRQLAILDAEEQAKRNKADDLGQDEISTSSDEEFQKQLKARKQNRKRQKLKDIQNSNKFKHNKKFNVTIPVPYQFDLRDKTRKISIRQMKLRQMLENKRKEEQQMMKPIPVKQVPQHVKQNLYQKLMKDQERQRLERLQRFRLQIQNSMVPMSDRLTKPKELDIHCDFSRQPYEFVARPMPWYCQVNLLDRINRKKMERRERILQEIINRHHDNDLPEGVLRMLQRHEALQEKRKIKKDQTETEAGTVLPGGGQCTFIPKISQTIPDFEALHQNLGIDLEIAKENKKQVFPVPFSFETRENRSRTHNCYAKKQKPLTYSRQFRRQEKKIDIKPTQKFTALVEKRKQERQKKRDQQEQEYRKQQMRKLRQMKFAPQVRQALKQNDNMLGRSRKQLQVKMKEFQKEEKRKKRQYEQDMINIYTKVWNRPLLIQTGQFGENQIKTNSRYDQVPLQGAQNSANYGQYVEQQPQQIKKTRQKSTKKQPKKERQQFNHQYQEKRRRAIQQAPGQYLIEQDSHPQGQQENEEYGQEMYNYLMQKGNGQIDENDPQYQQYIAEMMGNHNMQEYDDFEEGEYLDNNGMKTQ